eukprot:SAG31_NODE_58_length_29669_cov_20.244978_28_plen_102_part_00
MFWRALDLQLLAITGNGPEADELMRELRQNGLRIADRAKIRLLIGGLDTRLASVVESDDPSTTLSNSQRRRGQDREHADCGGAMSMDTIAIVFSVLVGAAG